MKRVVCLILAIAVLLSATACSGNFQQFNLNEPISIPENGIVEKHTLDKIKSENAIAVFTGASNGFDYEWTVFGSDINETRDVNLSVKLEKKENGLKIEFTETEDLGFPALLSVHLGEKWNADSATAYAENEAVYSVSVTGSKTESILNISVNKMVAECQVLPDNVTETESTSLENITLSDKVIVNDNKDNTDTTGKKDNYLSDVKDTDNRVYSNGSVKVTDKYETDPIPEGKPMPVEPENQEVNKKKQYTCTFSIECSTILNNLDKLDPDKRELVPSDGVILTPTKVNFYEGESVFDVLQRVCKENNIHMEASWTPVYNSAYVEGINNLYEFDCGELSGWMYRVNGWYPNYGCSRYQLVDGETVEWRYTCDLGNDVGREGSW